MRVSAGTVRDLNQKMYERIEPWRNRPIAGTKWGTRRYMNMERWQEVKREQQATREEVA